MSVQVLTPPELAIKHRVGKLGRHRKEGSCEGEQTSRIRLIMSLRITRKGQQLSTKMGFGTPSAITRNNDNSERAVQFVTMSKARFTRI